MHPMAVRIINGENVCPAEVREEAARMIEKMDDMSVAEGPHTPATCNSSKPKDCTHNIGSNRFFADVVRAKGRAECTCGQH